MDLTTKKSFYPPDNSLLQEGQRTAQDLFLPLFNIQQTMPRCQWCHSAYCFRVDTLLVSRATGLYYPSLTWQQETGHSSRAYILPIWHNCSSLIKNKERERSIYYPQHSISVSGGNLPCCLYILLVVLLFKNIRFWLYNQLVKNIGLNIF